MTGINETTFGSNSISESKKGENAANESGYAGSENLRNQKQNIEFSGNSSEYFGIWIVNIFLSIVTLGIYSAWAKVRRENYFKNNTKISGIGFGYHATGLQILRGRLIAVAFLVAINIAVSIYPILAGLTVPIFLFLVPRILNTSMRFAARMTSYRNIRFNWHGTYWKTFWFLVIAPALSLLTLGCVDKRDSQISGVLIQECFSGGILGTWRSDGRRMGGYWGVSAARTRALGAAGPGQPALSQRHAACAAGRLPLARYA